MPRPIKLRKVGFIPELTYFSPEGEKYNKDAIVLKYDELEAMRLKDIENLNQEECAAMMNISRQTFQLIIDEARHKVALSLVEGRPLKINGGNYEIVKCMHKCQHCGALYSDNDNGCCHKKNCPRH